MVVSQLLSPAATAPACRCPELSTFRRLLPFSTSQPSQAASSTGRFRAAQGRTGSSTPSARAPRARGPLTAQPWRQLQVAASGPGEGAPRVMIVSDLDNTMVREPMPGSPVPFIRWYQFFVWFSGITRVHEPVLWSKSCGISLA